MEYSIITKRPQEFIDITELVVNAIEKDNIEEGIVMVFVPHTTAGVTINENSDPDVIVDILSGLNQGFPVRNGYMHTEGNSHAHIKASIMGSSCNIIVENGKPKLGLWQAIYFCEFDGPRNRKIYIKSL